VLGHVNKHVMWLDTEIAKLEGDIGIWGQVFYYHISQKF